MSCLIFLCESKAAALAGGRLARSCDAVVHAVLNRVHDNIARTSMPYRSLDVVALLQVCSPGHRAKEVLDAAGRLGLTSFYQVAREVVLPSVALQGSVKRMSLLERSADLAPDQFREIWRDTHGPRVASWAGSLLGYCQNHVLLRSPNTPTCDGLTELWFPDLATMEAVLPPDPSEPDALTARASAFIARISTRLVTEVRLN